MKLIIFILMCCMSSTAFATTCIGNQQALIKRSEFLLNQVEFLPDISGSEIDVSFTFPAQIEGQKVSSTILVKENDKTKKVEFIFPLEMTPEGKQIRVWYMLSESMMDNNIIEVIYGGSCGLPIRYQLNYQKKMLEPVGFRRIP